MIYILSQLLLGILFLFAAFFMLTMPGLFFLKKLKIEFQDFWEKFTISSVLGLVLFTLTAYVLSAIHLRFLIWFFPILGFWSVLKFKKDLKINFKLKYKIFFLLVLIIGIIAQVAVNAPSGVPYQEGIYFWSSHGHDGIWHIALMEELKKDIFPFQNPEVAGEKLQNYHFFVDLLMSEFSRLYQFSTLDIYFRFMPVVFSLLLGLSSFIFVRVWTGKELAGIWAMIFTFFAGSFGYLLYVPTHGSLGGEAIFWLSQTHSVLGNPPHAAAFIIITVFLFILLKYLKNYQLNYFILCALLGAVVIEFKVYGGLLILGGLLVVGIWEIISKRRLKTILLFMVTSAGAFGIYFPNSQNSQGFLIFEPWWYIRTMVVVPDRLNWIDLELRRQHYLAQGTWNAYLRVLQLELTAFLIFLIGNLGMRFLGFWTIFIMIKNNLFKNSFSIFFLTIIIASFVIPHLFLQKGVAWNSIQFNQYFILFFGFLAGAAVTSLLTKFKNQFIKITIVALIIFLAIPTQIGLLWQFYSNAPLSKVTYNELEGLQFLKEKTDDQAVILTMPFNKYERDKYKNPPIPIYAWFDTGYVPAFSSRRTLISDEEQVNIMGYQLNELIEERKLSFSSNDYHMMSNFIDKFNIDYIYLSWKQELATDSGLLNLDLIFENKDAKIFKVRR